MSDFEQMYFSLFAALCDAIEAIDKTNYGDAKEILIRAQQKTEDVYIEKDEKE